MAATSLGRARARDASLAERHVNPTLTPSALKRVWTSWRTAAARASASPASTLAHSARRIAAQATGGAAAAEDPPELAEDEVARGVAVALVERGEALDVGDEDDARVAGQQLLAHRVHPRRAGQQSGDVVGGGGALERGDAPGEAGDGRRQRGQRAGHDLVEDAGVEAELGERGVEHVGVGGKAVEEVDGRVGGLDAGCLGAGHAAAVVGADRLEDARLEERLAGEDLAGVGVVDAEALALELGARGADGVLARDGVELLLAEGQGHDELAQVVQQAAEMGGLDIGAGALGQGAGDGGHLAGVHVQQPARRTARAGRELEEAADGGFEGQTPDADAADEGDGLAHGLSAHGARARGGVGEAQDVGGEPGVGLDRGDELVGVGLGIARQVADAAQGTIEHRQLADAPDGVLQLGVDRWGVFGRRVHRPSPIFGSSAQELSGGRRGAP